ncbi:MAG: hypothetical protein J6S81_04240, partial [Treponema sp.]|nr:hypothetical protein [Treponema sp.]
RQWRRKPEPWKAGKTKNLPDQGGGTVLPDAWSRIKRRKIFLLYFWAKYSNILGRKLDSLKKSGIQEFLWILKSLKRK